MQRTDDARLRVAVAGEDELHRSLAQEIVRRVVRRRARLLGAHWAEDPDAVLIFVDLSGADGDFFRHDAVLIELRSRLGMPPGRPLWLDNTDLRGKPHAIHFANLLRLAEIEPRRCDVVVALKDTDGREDPVEAWTALAGRRGLPLAPGTPHQDAEAWIVAGLAFDPSIALQRNKAKDQLNFDPCANPERLTHAPNGADRDAKRVLRFLTGTSDRLPSTPSLPPDPGDHAALLERAFQDFEGVSRAATGCRLAAFIDAVDATIGARAIPGPSRRREP